jgi:hypothetical protein
MPRRHIDKDPAAILLGYLNFSSGAFDPAAWRAMNELFAEVEPAGPAGIQEHPSAASAVAALLERRLDELELEGGAFRDATRARAVLGHLFGHLLPGYRRYHADLLEHQLPGAIERPYFVMAAAQALLAEEGLGEDDASVVEPRALARLNDYVGWRPVAVLENGRLSEPYPHERVRPIPVALAAAGPAHGRYRDLVGTALEILGRAPEPLVRQADFQPDLLEELAIDPRAFDFLHPAASRPNYLFGLWDPGRIDESGFYRRMVVQQVTLDGIVAWPQAAGSTTDVILQERRWEASAVLAGVVLMASGLSGHGPGAHLASLPLSDLLPRIAGYRDEFYRWLLTTLPTGHRARLEEEATRMRQPFGGVRRHINAVLASRRARQVESVALAAVFARIGRGSAAERLAGLVPAASARMLSRITSRVVAAQRRLRRHPDDLASALDDFDTASDLLFRAIGCGATVDPWNILGMAGQFPLHEPGGESLPDPRVDDLIAITESILEGYATAWRRADLAGRAELASRAGGSLERLSAWWDRFATTTVAGVPHLAGRDVTASAREVAAALRRRRESSEQPPPQGFWRRAVAEFTTPRTHAQAAEALLGEGDLDGAQGLLVHWASLLEGAVLERTAPAWLAAASRWLQQALADTTERGRARVRRFLEFVEANTSSVVDMVETAAAGHEPGAGPQDPDWPTEADDDPPATEESVAAAYESMVWRDSADDGVEGGMIDVDLPGAASSGPAALEDAAELLAGICRLLGRAVTSWCAADVAASTSPSRDELDAVTGWGHSLRRLRRALVAAAGVVAARDREPSPGMPPTEFDRLRWQRDAAAERLIDAAVQATETLWVLAARRSVRTARPPGRSARSGVGPLFAALLTGEATTAVEELERVKERLQGRPVLYVPLSRGGRPDRIAQARSRERLLERLASCLPRLGLVAETASIVQLAKSLENRRPAGAASVSEFDRVFEAATLALVERIVQSANETDAIEDGAANEVATRRILDGLSLLVPQLLETWMTHARQLRLSVLERLRDDRAFAQIRDFVERYGHGLFTQHVLAPSSLRGILRGGVRRYLERLMDQAAFDPSDVPSSTVADEDDRSGADAPDRLPRLLLEDLASGALAARLAGSRVRLVLESIAENHAEYRDWNSTTTQSDRGECLHILLEYLRVKAEYERIAWTLRPVGMAHRVLARRGAGAAAEAWRQRMSEETRDTAAELVGRLEALEGLWGVRLASVSDRVRRPFVAALEQDELESLVEPAVAELVRGDTDGAGERLERRAEAMLGVASGSGVEVPDWLKWLGDSVDRALERADAGPVDGPPPEGQDRGRLPDAVPWLPMAWNDLHASLERA